MASKVKIHSTESVDMGGHRVNVTQLKFGIIYCFPKLYNSKELCSLRFLFLFFVFFLEFSDLNQDVSCCRDCRFMTPSGKRSRSTGTAKNASDKPWKTWRNLTSSSWPSYFLYFLLTLLSTNDWLQDKLAATLKFYQSLLKSNGRLDILLDFG